jgi:MFS superfamily sulfate permease-like transporter
LNAAFFSVLLHRRKEKGFLILDIYYLLGGVILLALGLLMPAFYYLPKAVLAAVVISSVMFLVEYEEIKPMWKSRSIHLMNQQIHLFIVL